MNDSEYADDTAILFNSREDLEEEVPRIIVHLARFGIEVHSGLMHHVVIPNLKLIVDSFTYLGITISRDCSDEADVHERIQKAGCVWFGSKVFICFDVSCTK